MVDYLQRGDEFPSWRELFDQGALEQIELNINDLLVQEPTEGLYILSHRWESKDHPFPVGSEKISKLLTLLDETPEIKHLWIDYACLPQGERSGPEKEFFKTSLENANILYFTQYVILLIDLQCKLFGCPPPNV